MPTNQCKECNNLSEIFWTFLAGVCGVRGLEKAPGGSTVASAFAPGSVSSTSVGLTANKRRRAHEEVLDEQWELPEEEALLLGMPTDFQSNLRVLSRNVSNRRELRDLLCAFNCESIAAENLVDALSTSLTAAEQDRFYGEVLQSMIRWARALPTAIRSYGCKPAEPRSFALLSGTDRTVSMSRAMVRSVLAAAFLCLFQSPRDGRLSAINFEPLFLNASAPHECSKLLAFVNYFKRVAFEKPTGNVSFRRLVLARHPSWGSDAHTLPLVHVLEKGAIVDDATALRVVFGCRVVGGGVLIGGSWQEEGVFASHPEMLIASFIAENLADNEALLISGAERFSRMHGCAYHMAFAADWKDEAPCHADGSFATCFVIMDARDYRATGPLSQFLIPNIARDLGKAFIAFRARPDLPLATGAWGCGSHMGDPRLKFVLQLMAAAVAGVQQVHYFTFGDPQTAEAQRLMAQQLHSHNATVGDLWLALCKYSAAVEQHLQDASKRLMAATTNPAMLTSPAVEPLPDPVALKPSPSAKLLPDFYSFLRQELFTDGPPTASSRNLLLEEQI